MFRWGLDLNQPNSRNKRFANLWHAIKCDADSAAGHKLPGYSSGISYKWPGKFGQVDKWNFALKQWRRRSPALWGGRGFSTLARAYQPASSPVQPSPGRCQRTGYRSAWTGTAAWRGKVFGERLWWSVKYEEVYLQAYDCVGDTQASLAEDTSPSTKQSIRIQVLTRGGRSVYTLVICH